MTDIKLATPTPQLVRHYCRRFDSDEAVAPSEDALRLLFRNFPKNCEIGEVLLKVCAVNTLYSTQIYASTKMARHICSLSIDPRLAAKDATIVEEIANVTIKRRRYYFYSFATKYCSWHDPANYPIYDSYVDSLLWSYRRQTRFREFKRSDLRSYPQFKEIVESFRSYFLLDRFSLRELDKFLWYYGRELKVRP